MRSSLPSFCACHTLLKCVPVTGRTSASENSNAQYYCAYGIFLQRFRPLSWLSHSPKRVPGARQASTSLKGKEFSLRIHLSFSSSGLAFLRTRHTLTYLTQSIGQTRNVVRLRQFQGLGLFELGHSKYICGNHYIESPVQGFLSRSVLLTVRSIPGRKSHQYGHVIQKNEVGLWVSFEWLNHSISFLVIGNLAQTCDTEKECAVHSSGHFLSYIKLIFLIIFC